MSTQNQISSNSLSSSSSSSSSSLEKKPGTPENAGKESVSLPEHAKKRIASLNFTDQGNSSRKAFRTSGNQVEMSNKDVGIKQLRWTPAMDRCLLLVLAKEAREGKKGDKGFKKPSYARAASYVSKKFGVLCTADNVENRLRTTKKRYNFIMALQRNSEFGWDDTQKMITAHVQAYNDYIAVHPKAAQYLNRQIDMYDEMIIVCGKDQPTGSFDKSHAIVNVESADPVTEHEDFILDENIDAEETGEGMQFEKQQALTPDYSSSKARHHGKRSRSLEFFSRKIDEIAKQIGEVAAALKNTRYQDISHVLYSEVMKSEGFNESFLASAFDYLNEHDTIARSFLAKSPNLRQPCIYSGASQVFFFFLMMGASQMFILYKYTTCKNVAWRVSRLDQGDPKIDHKGKKMLKTLKSKSLDQLSLIWKTMYTWIKKTSPANSVVYEGIRVTTYIYRCVSFYEATKTITSFAHFFVHSIKKTLPANC